VLIRRHYQRPDAAAQLDERIVCMCSVLHDMDLNSDDIQASCRLHTAIVDMQFDRAYWKGARATERPSTTTCSNACSPIRPLEGQVERGNRTAGGFLDIIHDRSTPN
jgi:hypothetical protein